MEDESNEQSYQARRTLMSDADAITKLIGSAEMKGTVFSKQKVEFKKVFFYLKSHEIRRSPFSVCESLQIFVNLQEP